MSKVINLLSLGKKPWKIPALDWKTMISGVILAVFIIALTFSCQTQKLKKEISEESTLLVKQKEISVQKERNMVLFRQQKLSEQLLQNFSQNQITKKEFLQILIFLKEQKNIKFKKITLRAKSLSLNGEVAIISELKQFIAALKKSAPNSKIAIDKISGNSGSLAFDLSITLKNDTNI
jgi:hypothetical protein